jgi:phosphotransferase system enzyme I (PtsI)
VNERITYLYEPTHPAIIWLIRHVIEVAHSAGLWTGVCGEMAGNPVLAPLLVGLGIDELSMSPNLVPLVKGMIRSMRYHETEDLAAEAMASGSASGILDRCRQAAQRAAPEICDMVS